MLLEGPGLLAAKPIATVVTRYCVSHAYRRKGFLNQASGRGKANARGWSQLPQCRRVEGTPLAAHPQEVPTRRPGGRIKRLQPLVSARNAC